MLEAFSTCSNWDIETSRIFIEKMGFQAGNALQSYGLLQDIPVCT
jgi:hypothetical protein